MSDVQMGLDGDMADAVCEVADNVNDIYETTKDQIVKAGDGDYNDNPGGLLAVSFEQGVNMANIQANTGLTQAAKQLNTIVSQAVK